MKATDEYAKADDSRLRVALIIMLPSHVSIFFFFFLRPLNSLGIKKKRKKERKKERRKNGRLNSDYNYPRDRIISLLIALCYNRRVD